MVEPVKKLSVLSQNAVVKTLSKLHDGTYKNDPQAKQIIKQLPYVLGTLRPDNQIIQALCNFKSRDIQKLYPNLKRRYSSVRWDKYTHVAYADTNVCIIEDSLDNFSDWRTYEIYFKNSCVHCIKIESNQSIQFSSNNHIIGWKILDPAAKNQVEICLLNAHAFTLPNDKIKRFIVHSPLFSSKSIPLKILRTSEGLLPSFSESSVLFNNHQLRNDSGFEILPIKDIQYNKYDLATYINDNNGIYRSYNVYDAMDTRDFKLNYCTDLVYKKCDKNQWLQLGLAEHSYRYAVVESSRYTSDNPMQRYVNKFKLIDGYSWNKTALKEKFYSCNLINEVSFIWCDTYIAFVAPYDIKLYSLQYKFFFELNPYSGFTRVLPVYEINNLDNKFKEKKFELYLGADANRFQRYKFKGLKELDNCLQKKRLIKKNTLRLINEFIHKPSMFSYLIARQRFCTIKSCFMH